MDTTVPWVHQPLTAVLGTAAKVHVLRVLTASGVPISQREVARRARLAHRSVQLTLDVLVAVGLVVRLEGGRDRLVSLNEQHVLASVVQGLFATEAEFFANLRRELVAIGRRVDGDSLAALVLFGSVARAQEHLGSDLDLLILGQTETAADRLLEAYLVAAPQVRTQFGVRLQPIAYARQAARRRWKAREAPFTTVIRDAIVLHGPPIRELLA